MNFYKYFVFICFFTIVSCRPKNILIPNYIYSIPQEYFKRIQLFKSNHKEYIIIQNQTSYCYLPKCEINTELIWKEKGKYYVNRIIKEKSWSTFSEYGSRCDTSDFDPFQYFVDKKVYEVKNKPTRILNPKNKDSICYIIEGSYNYREIEINVQNKTLDLRLESDDYHYINDTANVLTKFINRLDSSKCRQK